MPSAVLTISDEDRVTLTTWTRSTTVSAGHAERAAIVLACADGSGTSEAARRLGVSRPTVIKWRDRFAAHGIAGLDDEPRSGRPKTIDDAAIIAATLEPPPERLGGDALVDPAAGAARSGVGRRHGRPGLARGTTCSRGGGRRSSSPPTRSSRPRSATSSACTSTRPRRRSCCAWTRRRQIQALDRTAPILPLRPGLPERATHDYKRNGTTTLFAALEVATGRVTDQCYDRHGKAEFLDFLKRSPGPTRAGELHVVLDNYHTHKHADINAWLAKNPRVTLHFTPTSGSWLNLVEVFFGIITRQAIRRGSFDSVPQLVTAIRAFIDGWNERCHPFAWTKTADEILPHATRQRNSDARH